MSVERWGMGILCVTLLMGCEDDAAERDSWENESFTLWCGDHACAWQLEEGEVAPVPTWHRSAKGIGFMSDPTVISQAVEMSDVSCLTLSIHGHLPEGAALYWEIDCGNDGMDDADPTIPIDSLSWETVYAETGLPADCDRARVILRKTGPGEGVLTQAALSIDSFCAPNESLPKSADSETIKSAGGV